MKVGRIVGSLFVAAALIAGPAWALQMALPGKIVVQSASDPHPKLTAGGPAVTVRLNGQNLGLVTGGMVLLKGVVVRDITVTLGPATTTSRSITLTAGSGLTGGGTGYQLRMAARDQLLDIPVTIFVMDVLVPSRTSTAVALPAVTQAFPAPNVDLNRVRSEGRVGTEVTFWGRDFLPDRFQATIGSTVLVALQITYRSTTQMRARLPEQKMAGPLVVSHGTEGSKVQLKPVFTVYGRPIVTAVRPLSFKQGDWVEIVGQDLHRSEPYTSNTSSANPWVGIQDEPGGIQPGNFVVAESWSVAENGTSARFRAGRPSIPETARLSGKLRIVDRELPGFIASPSAVTWTAGAPFVIDSVYAREQWNDQNVDFLLLSEQTPSNQLIARGTGILSDMRAKMGAVDLTTGACSGAQGEFRIPYTATTDLVQFTRSGSTVPSPGLIRVATRPKWDPAMPLRIKIVLNTEMALRGWGLKPTGITGLGYTIDLALPAGLPLQTQVLEHNENLIRFKVVATGPLPTGYQNYVHFNPNGNAMIQIVGRYQGGSPKTLLTKLYYLATQ